MSYFKVVLNNKVIDVLNNPVWVEQTKTGSVFRCSATDAMGVVSSDAEIIWHIDGARPFSGEEYVDVFVADITEDEADELKILLNLGADVANDDGGESVSWAITPVVEEPVKEDETIAEVRKRCLAKLSECCQTTIYNGTDVELSDGSIKHFDLKIEDQLNLLTLSTLTASGETSVPYHASDELCTYYSSSDIMRIIETATVFKTYHTSYYNSLKNWITSMDNIVEIGSVKYGDTIPSEYCSEVLKKFIATEEDLGETIA